MTHPVEITRVSAAALSALPARDYYYLTIAGQMDIDLEASGAAAIRCPVCYDREPFPQPRRLVPVPETWSGDSVFALRNFPSSWVFCTLDVLLLAREHRRTNFRFWPMGLEMSVAAGWKGIDYLETISEPLGWLLHYSRDSLNAWRRCHASSGAAPRRTVGRD